MAKNEIARTIREQGAVLLVPRRSMHALLVAYREEIDHITLYCSVHEVVIMDVVLPIRQ